MELMFLALLSAARTGGSVRVSLLSQITSLLIVVACRPYTDPENSEALAQAFRARLGERNLREVLTDPEAELMSEAVERLRSVAVHQTAFAGVEEGIAVDRQLRRLCRDYWGANRPLELDNSLGLADLREPLAAHHAEKASRFDPYVRTLRARIARDPNDTAARGLLATTVFTHLVTSDMYWTGHPHLEQLAVSLLDIDPPAPPHCVLFSAAPDAEEELWRCQASPESWKQVSAPANELALEWVDEIATQTPDSTWIEVARLLVSTGPKPSRGTEFELPVAHMGDEPRLAANLVVLTDLVQVDNMELLRLEDGAVPEAELRGSMAPRLYDRLAQLAFDSRQAFEMRGVPFEPRLNLQLDRRHHLGLLRQLLYTVGQTGYTQFDLVVEMSVSDHVITWPRLVVLPFRLPELGEGEKPLFLPEDDSVDALVAAIETWREACTARTYCDPAEDVPPLVIVGAGMAEAAREAWSQEGENDLMLKLIGNMPEGGEGRPSDDLFR